MIDSYTILNEDCLISMEKNIEKESVDLVMTSPPYNMTKRKGGTSDSGRYDVYVDWKSEEDYLSWTKDVFLGFNRILKPDSVVLYNFSYSIENPSLPYKLVGYLENTTPFMLVDTIIWKKSTGLPFPANKHRLSRNWEFVFVFVRKSEKDSFRIHREITKTNTKGQNYYSVVYNMVEARNNDTKTTELNQATYSTELCLKLFKTYLSDGYTVYDPFSGTGTTANACLMSPNKNLTFIGSEISKKQCEYTSKRLSSTKQENSFF